jgi:hypothetical protein
LFDASLVADEEPAVTVAPGVPALPLIVKVGAEHVAVKLIPVTLADVIVTELEAGEKVQPLLVGVTV